MSIAPGSAEVLAANDNPTITLALNLAANPLRREWDDVGLPDEVCHQLALLERAQRGFAAVVRVMLADERLRHASTTWAGWDHDAFDDDTRQDLIHAADTLQYEVERRFRLAKKAAKQSAEGASE